MTAEQAIKNEIKSICATNNWCEQDATEEFRSSYDQETDIECDWSLHYDSKSVAKKLDDGRWVGYTYWSGGGKHGEPEAIDWIGDAYFLKVIGERHTVEYEFEKA